MSDGSNYLDTNRPDAVRLSVGEARALGEAALARIGYGEDDARIITDQGEACTRHIGTSWVGCRSCSPISHGCWKAGVTRLAP